MIAPASPTARDVDVPVRSLTLAGAIGGSLGLGLPIGFTTLVHNRAAGGLPATDAVVLLVACLILYGGAGAGAAALFAPLRRDRALGRGMWLLGSAFGLGFFLHGTTYEQVPFGEPAGLGGMLFYVAAATVGIGIAAVLVVALARRPLAWAAATLRWRGALLAWAAIALVGVLWRSSAPEAVSPPQEGSEAPAIGAIAPPAARVALIGLDGADWRVLQPMIDRGETPHFARLVAEGVRAPLRTIVDSNSPVIWASIYTGRQPDQHRVLDFFRIQLPGMQRGVFPVHRTFFREFADALTRVRLARLRPISRFDLAATPIWEIADRCGIRTALVDGYYYSFPAPRFDTAGGYAIAYGADGFWQQVRRAGSGQRAQDAGLFVQPPERLRDIRDHLSGADFDWQANATLALLDTQPTPTFLSFYTHEPDTVQHFEWKWFEPAKFPFVDPAETERRADRIPERYRAFDRFLGELRARLGPDTAIVVVSDHGHAPTVLHQDYYSQHRHGPPGLIVAAGGPLRRGANLPAGASIFDVFPTVLYLLGLPVPADGHGRLLDDAIEPAALAAHPPRSIDTYEGRWPPPFTAATRSGLEAEELEKLRALGYL